MNRGVWHATVHGVTKSQTELMTEYACYVCVCVCVCMCVYLQTKHYFCCIFLDGKKFIHLCSQVLSYVF